MRIKEVNYGREALVATEKYCNVRVQASMTAVVEETEDYQEVLDFIKQEVNRRVANEILEVKGFSDERLKAEARRMKRLNQGVRDGILEKYGFAGY